MSMCKSGEVLEPQEGVRRWDAKVGDIFIQVSKDKDRIIRNCDTNVRGNYSTILARANTQVSYADFTGVCT